MILPGDESRAFSVSCFAFPNLDLISIVSAFCTYLVPDLNQCPKASPVSAGRPTKFSPEITAQILRDVEDGIYLKIAAQCAGVSRQTVYSWLKRGKRTGEADKPYREFLGAFRQAWAKGQREFERSACRMAKQDGKAALDLLARLRPNDWGSDRSELRRLRKIVEKLAAKLGETIEDEH